MKVSVLIPVRSGYDLGLTSTLRSLRAQDDANHEVLLLWADGDCQRGSEADALAAGGPRVRVIPVPAGALTGEILNRGLHEARGEVIARLNPGEQFHPGAITVASIGLARHPDRGAIYGETYRLTPDGAPAGPQPGWDYDHEEFLAGCPLTRPAVLWRRGVCDLAGTFDEVLEGDATDYDFWLRVGRVAPIERLVGCLFGGGWPVSGQGCGAAAMLRVSRQHGSAPGAARAWLRRIAGEGTVGGGETVLADLRPRERYGYVGRLLLAAAELGVEPDETLLAELHAGLGEVER